MDIGSRLRGAAVHAHGRGATLADVYDQQNIVNHEAVDLFTHQSDLAAPMVSYTNGNLAIPPAEKHSLLHDIAIVALRLETLRQLTEQLDKQYTDTLSK